MSKLIDKLTPEQEALIPVYLEEFRKIGLSTEPCNRKEAEKALTEAQEYLKLPKPEFIWVDSPYQGIVMAAKLANGTENPTKEQIKEQVDYMSYGSFDAYWGSFYSYIAEVLPVQKDNLANIVRRIMENCGCYWVFEGLIVVSEKPKAIHMKDEKLHNPDGLALEYHDGNGLFAINGTVYNSMMDMEIQNKLGTKK